MKRYIVKRLGTGLLTILFSFVLTFFLIRFAPGNPVSILAGKDNPNPEQIAHLTEKYGLNEPLPKQFAQYIKNALRGDFGYSYKSNRPVTQMIGEKIIPTLVITLTGSVLSVLIGTFMGLRAGQKKGSKFDRFFLFISYLVDAIPSFWLAMILILLFASHLHLFPTSGMYDIRMDYKGGQAFLDLLYHMFLPVLTLVIIQVPIYFRIARTSVLQVLNENFVRTFRAVGMEEQKIFRKYVLKNALIPVITTFSMSLAFLISGVALIEIVFAWPGMGRLIMDSISGRDYCVLTAIYLMISISITFFMVIADFLYALLDPRIRLQ